MASIRLIREIRCCTLCVVRLTGLEPARRETLDPKSNASTNSATGAFSVCGCKGTKISVK